MRSLLFLLALTLAPATYAQSEVVEMLIPMRLSLDYAEDPERSQAAQAAVQIDAGDGAALTGIVFVTEVGDVRVDLRPGSDGGWTGRGDVPAPSSWRAVGLVVDGRRGPVVVPIPPVDGREPGPIQETVEVEGQSITITVSTRFPHVWIEFLKADGR